MRVHRRPTAIAFAAIAALCVLLFSPVAARAADASVVAHVRPGPGHGHWHHHRSHWGWGFGIGIGLGHFYDPIWAPVPVVVVPQVAVDESSALNRLPAAPEPVIEPRQGQGAAQTEADRRACNRWATTQAQAMADAAVFHRMTLSCMEGRGYAVR